MPKVVPRMKARREIPGRDLEPEGRYEAGICSGRGCRGGMVSPFWWSETDQERPGAMGEPFEDEDIV